MGASIATGMVFFMAGIIFWGGFNTAMEVTNTMEFCVGCHEMKVNVYEEYKPTQHYSNRTGVRAGCPDCHVPDPWFHKIVRKIQASNEVYHKIIGTIDTPEKFDQHRLAMAKRVWKMMKETDSRECRNCHNFESMAPQFQTPRARHQHLNAFKEGQTCIDCHKGVAHNDISNMLTDEELLELEAPNPEFIREIPQMYLDGLKLVTEQEEQQRLKSAAQRQLNKEAEERRIKKAVAATLAKYNVPFTAEEIEKTLAAEDSSIDWSKASSRIITLFYPGETPMEWVLNSPDHGGARLIIDGGERCVVCHDSETAKMGEKMVTGEKAESYPIPGKRGSIPVEVKTTHDGEYLYIQFSWQDSQHMPVPFVEGGKMDPENPMKLAMMFATDDTLYAGRAGCWGSCHADERSMPDTPGQAVLAETNLKSRLDFSMGVTKYLEESRSEIEIKGLGGKPRGGWDKLLAPETIRTKLESDQYLDIIRYKSGTHAVEDGHVLSQRLMSGGQGAEFTSKLEDGEWTVTMKRKLVSDKAGDINLALDQIYNFGFAIHDDYSNSRFHHVSLGYKLGFDNPAVELNATKQ